MENEELGFWGSIKAGMTELKTDFKKDKVAKGSKIMTNIIRISSVIGAIVAFIIFIMMDEVIGLITCLFLLVQIILFIVLFFRDISKAKKVCMILNLLLIFADILIMITFQLINYRTIPVSQGVENKIKSLLGSFSGGDVREGAEIFVMILLIVAVVFFLFMILQLRFEIGSEYIKEFGKNVAFTYIFIPLALLLIENIIPIIVGIVGLVIVIGAIILGGKIFLNGDGESSGSSVSSNLGRRINVSSSNSRQENRPKEKYQQKKEYHLNTIFWRDKGGCGIVVPQADCIYVKNAWGEKTYVCTVDDFEKGNVVIINKKARIINVAGCKTPER